MIYPVRAAQSRKYNFAIEDYRLKLHRHRLQSGVIWQFPEDVAHLLYLASIILNLDLAYV